MKSTSWYKHYPGFDVERCRSNLKWLYLSVCKQYSKSGERCEIYHSIVSATDIYQNVNPNLWVALGHLKEFPTKNVWNWWVLLNKSYLNRKDFVNVLCPSLWTLKAQNMRNWDLYLLTNLGRQILSYFKNTSHHSPYSCISLWSFFSRNTFSPVILCSLA